MNDKSGRVQVMQVLPKQFEKAKAEVAARKEDASKAKTLFETCSGTDTEKADLKKAMETLASSASEAEAALPLLEKHMNAWPLYIAGNNELLGVEITLPIDPIKLSELQPPTDALCEKCGRSPNNDALTVEETMILFPLLEDDAS